MSSEQTQTKTYFNANIIVNSKNHQFIAKTVQHWYFTTNVQNIRKILKYPPFE